MSIQVTGVLRDPLENIMVGAKIRLTALETTKALSNTAAEVITDITGSYDFTLLEGKFKIEINQSNKYHKIAYLNIPAGTLPVVTVEDLINIYEYCEVTAPTCPS